MSYLAPGHAALKFHPLANLFPVLQDPELDDLGEDIRANGQVETVKLHKGMVLDGRNRYTACARKNLGVRTEIFEGSDRDALNWVISKNLKRRHLNESQRARIADKITTLRLGDNQHSQAAQICAPAFDLGDAAPETEPPIAVSQTDAADQMSVSRRLVQHAAVVREKGAEELGAAVDAGKLAISAAAEIATLPIEQQREIIAKADPKAVKEVAKKNRQEKTKKTRQQWLDAQASPSTMALFTGRKATVLYVDVPREFKVYSDETGVEKSPGIHYRTEAFDALANMRDKILELANPDCFLAMWGWASSLPDQMDLMSEWGFASRRQCNHDGRLTRGTDGVILPPVGEGRYRSHLIWAKRNASGSYHRGTGFWFIDCHELLLVGARGNVRAPEPGTQSLSIFDAPIGEHSAKPEGIRDLLDAYFPNAPKTELFGRVDDIEAFKKRWPTWEVMGNEARMPEQPSLDIGSAEEAA